jgi:hypothetical protein
VVILDILIVPHQFSEGVKLSEAAAAVVAVVLTLL